ncbi:GDSL-type esterase/lipase family protein [Salinithrix halophila]|uniref:GDSL-type esterase/lipase family protein n=1 Tax=Salinithrix halophila TaxID=1485204 RepID=A0ABV8JL72_9BACL
MKKWILLAASLSLVAIAVKLYPVAQILLAEEPAEPIVVSNVNIMGKLKQTADKKKKLNYLVLGDSVARGIGSKHSQHGYSSLVVKGLGKERVPLRLINKGVVGQTSKKLYEAVRTPDVESHVKKADMISLTIGGNDLIKVALEQDNRLSVLSDFNSIQSNYQKNLAGILSHIRKMNPDAPILLTSLYNPISPDESYYNLSNKLLKKWNVGLKEVAYRYSMTHVVDVNTRLRAGKGTWLSDEIHPNDRGYRMIADGILHDIRFPSQTSAKAGK